ncbi:MAG: hypothetical protein LBI65_03245 [Candidatus Symbiothrix sp.]|nr:hypothetical protein [Candidatus Symbiothrix sp.]
MTGQILFPNWIKTMKLKQGDKPVWNVENAFYQTFLLANSQSGNSEPRFEDGTTVLSSLGTPDIDNVIITYDMDGGEIITTTKNKGTYTNRGGITPIYNNWKE